MGINLIAPGSASPTAALFYDTGAFGSVPKMTKVGGNTVSAAVEIQSTSGAFLLPRMSTAQRNALTTVVDGMEVYDSTLNSVFTRVGAAWVRSAAAAGIQYATGALTRAQLITMFSAPTVLLPAPGALRLYVVNGFLLNLAYGGGASSFINGGDVTLQYSAASNPGAAFDASFDLTAALFTGAAVNKSSFANGNASSITTANGANAPIAITNAAANFANGNSSSATWHIWYSIIPVD